MTAAELLTDVDAQLKELTTLVGDLVDMAREDERTGAEPEPVPFNDIVERAVERAHRRAQSLHFDVSLQPGEVRAQPASVGTSRHERPGQCCQMEPARRPCRGDPGG